MKKIILDDLRSTVGLSPMIITPFNYQLTKEKMERVSSLPSSTLPDQSYTIREILAKFTMGVMPSIGKDPQYTDTEDFNDVDITRNPDFDLSDVSNSRDNVDRLTKQYESQLQEAEKIKAQKTPVVTELAQKGGSVADDKGASVVNSGVVAQ